MISPQFSMAPAAKSGIANRSTGEEGGEREGGGGRTVGGHFHTEHVA